MITLFVLLGLALLGGGAFGIVDGWPYLVLERGFTQVIVGTVAVTGGLILLALSWTLVEIRRVRTTLSNAVLAASFASMANEAMVTPEPARPAASRDMLPEFAAVAGGAAVGAGVIAATSAAAGLADSAAEEKAKAEPAPEDEAGTPDQAVARDTHEQEPRAFMPLAEAEPDEPALSLPEKHEQPDESVADDPEPDWLDEPESGDRAATVAPSEPVFTESGPQAAEQGRAEPTFDELLRWPEPETPAMDVVAAHSSTIDDEFGALRESLSLRLGERDQAPAPIEPSDTAEPSPDVSAPGDIETASSWMAPLSRQQDSWFPHAEKEAEPEPEPVAVEPPVAPVTEALPAQDAFEVEPAPAWDHEPGAADEAGQPVEVTQQTHAPAAEPEPAATSDEGVVGAYQVGDAYFTIFADGSIKARTPDGNYDFASMDELKTYLASERSRLGV